MKSCMGGGVGGFATGGGSRGWRKEANLAPSAGLNACIAAASASKSARVGDAGSVVDVLVVSAP